MPPRGNTYHAWTNLENNHNAYILCEHRSESNTRVIIAMCRALTLFLRSTTFPLIPQDKAPVLIEAHWIRQSILLKRQRILSES